MNDRRAAQGDWGPESGLTDSDSRCPDLPRIYSRFCSRICSMTAGRDGLRFRKPGRRGHGQGYCRARRISRLFFSKLTRKTFSPPVAKSAVMVLDSSKS
jgi:hypothetical protein